MVRPTNKKSQFNSSANITNIGEDESSNIGGKGQSRKDPAWKHSVQVEVPGIGKTYVYLKCNYCEKEVKGGVTRMKDHLSGSHKNVAPCSKVPEEVRDEIRAYIKKTTVARHLAQRQFDAKVDNGCYYGSGSAKDSSSLGPHPHISNRGVRGPIDRYMMSLQDDGNVGAAPLMSSQHVKEARRRVCLDIGRFFYENAIAFNVATSPSYYAMVRSIGEFGRGLRPPSMYELRTWVLKEELNTTERVVEEIKKSWPQTGVTIMSDGWSDGTNRNLINILVNNPTGTIFLKSIEASDKVKDSEYIFKLLDGVVEEIGEHLVVQVVTDNASAYKAAGGKLMEKRKNLYWTPCAAHCIDLILERLGDLPQHKHALTKAKKVSKFIYNHSWVLALMRKFAKRELIRPAATRFATAYLTLQSLLESRQPLESMFTSAQWSNCAWAKKPEGKEVRKIILNQNFWRSVNYAITSTKPLVQVLRMVDAEKNPAMGFIYNAMDEAKEEIAKALGGEEGNYKEIWDIIDEKWELQMHRHLHAAGYFLNPRCQYDENKSTDPEIKLGLYHCMDRLIPNSSEREKADLQIVTFRNKVDFFGLKAAKDTVFKRSPVEWWIQFGDGTPELQKFAIKVLGLTCSSSGCERNWSTYSQVHTKSRNRLTTIRMNTLVYIMFNKRLKDKDLKKKALECDEDPLLMDDVTQDDEWLANDEDGGSQLGFGPSQLHEEDLNIDVFEGVKNRKKQEASNTKGKRKAIEIEDDEEELENLAASENEEDERVNYLEDSDENMEDESDF